MDAISFPSIAARLLRAREHRRLSQSAVIRHLQKVGYHASTTSVGEYERGTTQAPVAYVAAFCHVLAFRADWLVLGEGPMETRSHSLAEMIVEVVRQVSTSKVSEPELRLRLQAALDLLGEEERPPSPPARGAGFS